jgi:hypothetical protein
VLDVALRAYVNPRNLSQEAAGPFSNQYATVSGGLWLTRANRAELRRLSGGSGAFTIDPTPADAGAGNFWPQLPETPDELVSSSPLYGDFDYPPTG